MEQISFAVLIQEQRIPMQCRSETAVQCRNFGYLNCHVFWEPCTKRGASLVCRHMRIFVSARFSQFDFTIRNKCDLMVEKPAAEIKVQLVPTTKLGVIVLNTLSPAQLQLLRIWCKIFEVKFRAISLVAMIIIANAIPLAERYE